MGGSPAALSRLLEHIAAEHGWQIVATEVMPDHVHLLVRVEPTDAPAQVVRVVKGRTAWVLGQEFPHLRDHAQVWWSPSYLAASVGYVSGSTVRAISCISGSGDGLVRRAYVFRLRPTSRQHIALAACVESHREL